MGFEVLNALKIIKYIGHQLKKGITQFQVSYQIKPASSEAQDTSQAWRSELSIKLDVKK